jgi:hypothetical protein
MLAILHKLMKNDHDAATMEHVALRLADLGRRNRHHEDYRRQARQRAEQRRQRDDAIPQVT